MEREGGAGREKGREGGRQREIFSDGTPALARQEKAFSSYYTSIIISELSYINIYQQLLCAPTEGILQLPSGFRVQGLVFRA